MGRDRRPRRRGRAQEFGARYPRLALVIACILLAAVIALYGLQLSYGTYLGRGWVIAAVAGMVTAAGLIAAVLISYRRHSLAADRLGLAWLVLALMSASGIRFPFPQGRYGSVQAFFDVVHAAMLGFEAVTCTAIIALMAYALLHPRARARLRAARVARAGREPGRAEIPARLRFPGAESPTWRAGRLIAASGAVTWQSWKDGAEVDLTPACQALPMLPAGRHGRQPRITTLATAGGLAEVDVSPKALAALAASIHRPHTMTRPHGTAQD